MTRAVVNTDEAMVKSLHEIVKLFQQAQIAVFRLMASVSSLLLHAPRVVTECPKTGLLTKVHARPKICSHSPRFQPGHQSPCRRQRFEHKQQRVQLEETFIVFAAVRAPELRKPKPGSAAPLTAPSPQGQSRETSMLRHSTVLTHVSTRPDINRQSE